MGATTLSGAIGNVIYFFAQIAVTWVPALVGSVTATTPGAVSPISPISQPVSASQALAYFQQSSSPDSYARLVHGWTELVAISIVISLILAALLIYCVFRILEVRRHERAHFKAMGHTVAARDIPKTHLRWNKIVEEANSTEERNWRLAILEADIMLNELLDVQGYRGETMGDKMKQVDKADFKTIDLAWEAHKTRNAIAHQGTAFPLTQREVRRVIGLYEQVFREFKFIE